MYDGGVVVGEVESGLGDWLLVIGEVESVLGDWLLVAPQHSCESPRKTMKSKISGFSGLVAGCSRVQLRES